MKSKKTMLILPVVAVALCAVALIGAGFAIQYTGVTSNTGNDVNSTYITVGSSSYASTFDHEIHYNTTTTPNQESGTTTTYVLNTNTPGYVADINNEGPGVMLGTVTLTITEDGTKNNFNLAIKHSGEIIGTYLIGYRIGDNEQTTYIDLSNAADSGCTIENIEGVASTTIEIDLYIIVNSTNDKPSTNPVNGVTFTFTATAGTA